MSDYFSRFPDFIREYIYKSGWEALREIQTKAAGVIFGGERNLLISSETASGKTEAALFPVITGLYENPSRSFGALYIAPLKSLINDQFGRLGDVLDESGIPVFHWHGDVSASHKKKALDNPAGILQITPESLESLLMNRYNDIPRIFSDLRYVIIDEVHCLISSDRGNQIICQLCRIGALIGHDPVRIGLSATVGDAGKTAEWLGAGTGRETSVVSSKSEKIRWRLGLEQFFRQDNDGTDADAMTEYVYDCTKNKKCLVFSNSREETEYITAALRACAARRNERDVFQIHHGNLSASIREEAETNLKNDDKNCVTCATVTLELGIDIGRLERIVHLEAPFSVSSFLQRIGRSGRRGDPPEMMMVFGEDTPLPNTPLPQIMPWSLIRAIAIIQLYVEERFIEPPRTKKMPFSLLFQQTLSVLSSCGSLKAAELAGRVLNLPPFTGVDPADYKALIVAMLKGDYLEMTESKELIVGLRGERLTNSFKFYAVFKDSEDFTVRAGSDEIGTITSPPPIGDRFALAGKVWEVEDVDVPRRLIYAHQVDGRMEVSWPGDYGEIHTKILERMKKVLGEDTVYPYLKPNAVKRLAEARAIAANTGMLESPIVHLGGYSWCVFPWLGTRSFRTFRKIIAYVGKDFGISNISYEGSCYITFRMENGNAADLFAAMNSFVGRGLERGLLVSQSDLPIFEKYDEYIPMELLRKAYAEDRMESSDTARRIAEIYGIYN